RPRPDHPRRRPRGLRSPRRPPRGFRSAAAPERSCRCRVRDGGDGSEGSGGSGEGQGWAGRGVGAGSYPPLRAILRSELPCLPQKRIIKRARQTGTQGSFSAVVGIAHMADSPGFTPDMISTLLRERAPENRSRDYKLALPGNSDRDVKDFLIDVSAFANT